MNQVQNCVQIINQHIKNFKPDVGLILGSGLGQFCDNIKPKASLNFEDLPGFPVAGVGGHVGKLLFGEIQEPMSLSCRVEPITMSMVKLILWLLLLKY